MNKKYQGHFTYAQPRDPKHPLVYFDERTKEQHREVVEPSPSYPARPPTRKARTIRGRYLH